MNRQITGRIATWHFAPTALSRNNLRQEGVDADNIHITGNTVIDTLYHVVSTIRENPILRQQLNIQLRSAGYETTHFAEQSLHKMVLITGHRRENFGDGFIQICQAIKTLAERYAEVDFVYPMHLNPNVRKPIHKVFGNAHLSNLFFIEPLEYLPFVYLMEKSTLVLTDSGGIQEEAPGLGKPVLVMRDTTERPEALDAGTVKLVGTDYDRIVNEVSRLLDDNAYYNRMSQAINPYGDGTASQRIVQTIEKAI